MSRTRSREWIAYALAAALVGCAAVISHLLGGFLEGPPRSVFVAAVVVCAALWGKRVAVASAVFAAVGRYFVIRQTERISVDEVAGALVFVAIGYGVAALVGRIREQREWLKVTLESVGDAVMITDKQGCITFLNAVAERLTGWSNSDAQGMTTGAVFKIVNEFTGMTATNPVEIVLAEKRVVELENHTILISKSGEHYAIEDSAAPIRDRHGDGLGVVMVFHDVSARRRAERQAAEHRQLLQTTLASIGDAVLTTDEKGKVTYLNPVAEILTEWQLAEARGLPFSTVANW